jgi:RNA polymerase sigma-70 factor (ECF subfamily)
MQVAKHKAIDHLRRNRRQIDLEISDQEKTLIQSGYTFEPVFNHIWEQINIEDEMLQMMFACCHDSISVENQITLMLKTLCGFSTLEISRALITSEETISKRLYRTKEFFRTNQIKPEITDQHAYESKLDSVLKAIYLLFNEGYLSTHSDQSIRKDLIHQALYLGSILCGHPKTNTAKVNAAMSLMCFHAARLDSRLDASGDIILLAQQDRSKWDLQLIAKGMTYLDQSAQGDLITTYHLEAAIAYEHCLAPTYEHTNWKKILQFYDWLESIQPNPIVALNRMVAFSKCHDIRSTLEALSRSAFIQQWQIQPVYHALLGDLYAKEDLIQSKVHYQQAAELTHSIAEKKLMLKKIEQLKI